LYEGCETRSYSVTVATAMTYLRDIPRHSMTDTDDRLLPRKCVCVGGGGSGYPTPCTGFEPSNLVMGNILTVTKMKALGDRQKRVRTCPV